MKHDISEKLKTSNNDKRRNFSTQMWEYASCKCAISLRGTNNYHLR